MPLVSLRKLAPWREVIDYNCHESAGIIMALTVQFSKINWYRSNIKLTNQMRKLAMYVHVIRHDICILNGCISWTFGKPAVLYSAAANRIVHSGNVFGTLNINFFLFSKTCNNHPMVRRCYTGLETIPINTIKRYNSKYYYFVVTFNLQSPWLSLCHICYAFHDKKYSEVLLWHQQFSPSNL